MPSPAITVTVPTRTSTSLSVGRLDYLDGLRAVTSLYVLIHHAVLQVDLSALSPFAGAFASIFGYGRFAVDFFIVISGFCLMLPIIQNSGVLKKGAIHFFKRRVRRILPTYYFAMALSLLLIFTIIGQKTGTNWDISLPVSNWDIIAHLLLVQDVFEGTLYTINHTFWSISVEWHIYFLFPLLVLFWAKLGPTITTIFTIFLSLALWYLLGKTDLNVHGMAPHYIALFTFGMLSAYVSFDKLELWKIVVVLVFAIAASAVHPIILPDFAAGIFAACLLALVSTSNLNLVRQFLSWQPLVFIGTFSYSIYLIHAPLLQVISQYMISPLNLSPSASVLFFMLIGVPVIILCSYMFFIVAERPFMTKK